MRKTLLVILLFGSTQLLNAQSFEVQQLLLNVEKLSQLKSILDDMKKGYEIVSRGYSSIRDLSQGNFSLHKTFLDGLLAVSPTVRNYRKVAVIVSMQLTVLKEYKSAASTFRSSDLFSVDELQYMDRVYAKLFKESMNNLDDLTMIITASQLRMSDDERLKAIDGIHEDMQDKLQFLRQFNRRSKLLAVQRSGQRSDAQVLQKLYGLK